MARKLMLNDVFENLSATWRAAEEGACQDPLKLEKNGLLPFVTSIRGKCG
jgi:hypothetical protein